MGALLLTREDGRALVVELCDTVEHMRANERSGFYQTQVAKFAGKLVDPPGARVLRRRGRQGRARPPGVAAQR
jgi:hypothetical protein